MWLFSGFVGVAAPPWVPDLRRGRRFGGMPDVGKGWQVGGVAALPVRPWAVRERPIRGWFAGAWVWLCRRFVGVAAPPMPHLGYRPRIKCGGDDGGHDGVVLPSVSAGCGLEEPVSNVSSPVRWRGLEPAPYSIRGLGHSVKS